MKHWVVGITTLLCAAATAAAQTPVQTLSHIGRGETLHTPPHIVVVPDGSSTDASSVKEWRESFASAPHVFRPGISTDIDPEVHAMPRSAVLDLYPNPVRDFLTERYSMPPGTTARLVLYDALGRSLDVNPVPISETNTFTLHLADRRPGLYFVRLHSHDDVITRRVVLLR